MNTDTSYFTVINQVKKYLTINCLALHEANILFLWLLLYDVWIRCSLIMPHYKRGTYYKWLSLAFFVKFISLIKSVLRFLQNLCYVVIATVTNLFTSLECINLKVGLSYYLNPFTIYQQESFIHWSLFLHLKREIATMK